MLILVLVLMGLTALVATVAPPERGVRGRGAETATPSPSTVADEPAAGPKADVTANLSAAPGKRLPTVRAELGDQVVIVVDSQRPDSVALGDLDVQPAERGVPARFDLLADTPGRYPIVMVDGERRIATLVVR